MTYFTMLHIILFSTGYLLFLASFIIFLKGDKKLPIVLLAISGVFIYSFAAHLDPYLNLWDERFHALVAKNLMHHPLLPTLYENPVVDMAYDRWDRAVVWLHKQPLFLWQIALSFKIFGVSEFSLRIPAIVLCTILIPVSYRTGKLLVNKRTGYLTAVLILSSNFLLELVSGRQSLDQNDISFFVYVSLGIWSLCEYYHSKNRLWLILIGLFTGCAILCKWLVGLIVYFGWLILIMYNKPLRLRNYKNIFLSFIITCVVVLPWQIYTSIRFPIETKMEFAYNAGHFSEALEGHGGNTWFYIENFSILYGRYLIYFILPAFWIFYKRAKDKKLFWALASMVIAIYLFFTFASTKMITYPWVIALIVFVAFAALTDFLLCQIEKLKFLQKANRIIIPLIITVIVLLRINIEEIHGRHTTHGENNWYPGVLSQKTEFYKNLSLPGNSVLFNVQGPHYIEAMFYTGIPAYNFIPDKKQYTGLKRKGLLIFILTDPDTRLPEYLTSDQSVRLIPRLLLIQ